MSFLEMFLSIWINQVLRFDCESWRGTLVFKTKLQTLLKQCLNAMLGGFLRLYLDFIT